MYDDDLSGVVRNVHRRNAEASSRLANHPLTRAYLEAGVRLLEREFSAQISGEERLLRPLGTVTREAVIAEVANGPSELPRHGTAGSFRDRWEYFGGYLSDLARYALRRQHWSPASVIAAEAGPVLSDGDFVPAVHEIAYRDSSLAINSTALHFRFLATTLAGQDKVLHEAIASVYREITETWATLGQTVFRARGLTLRAGMSFEDLAMILTALNEGLALRVASDPNSNVLDAERRRSLLGYAALALLVGCADTGDGLSLDELADRIARANVDDNG